MIGKPSPSMLAESADSAPELRSEFDLGPPIAATTP